MAGKIVVDASVLLKWVKTKNEELVQEARKLLTKIEAGFITFRTLTRLRGEAEKPLGIFIADEPGCFRRELSQDGLVEIDNPFGAMSPLSCYLKRLPRCGSDR